MKLRKKTVVVVAGTFIVLTVILYLFLQLLLLKSFENLEKIDVSRNIHTAINSLERVVEGIDILTGDWAAWDDTYAFMGDRNQAYLTSNITDETFIVSRLNLIAYYDASGKLFYGKAFNYNNEEVVDLPGLFLKESFSKDKILVHRDTKSIHAGILMLEKDTLLFSSRPITTSNTKGPIRGTLILGRYLVADEIDKLSKEMLLPIKVFPYGSEKLGITGVDATHFEKEGMAILPISKSHILGLGLIRDIYGKPALVVRAEFTREISAMGNLVINYFMLYLLISGIILALVLILLIDRTVLSRIKNLGKSLSEVGSRGDLSVRISTEGNDEISALAVQVEGMLSSLREFETDRKRAENIALRFGRIMDNSSNEIYIFDADSFIFTLVNSGACKNLGYSMDELRQLTPLVLKPEFTEKSFTELLRPLRNGQQDHITFKTVHKRKDGSLYPVEVRLHLSSEESPTVYVAIIQDITVRNKMEAKLIKTEKLESVGILAGGIAHDFNNLLATILGNVSYAKDHADPDGEIFTSMKENEKAIERARDLTKQLLTFSRGGMPLKKVQQIGSIVREAAKFGLRGSNVELDLSISSDLKAVEIDEGQLSQVINNMVINACHAMPIGGSVEIKADNITVSTRDSLPIESGEYINISIKDNGVGIAQEDMEKIFDPFYTTKLKGSGLGLATSHTIIKNHNGYIDISSVVDKGTIFNIFLPVSSMKYIEEKVEEEVPISGEGRVLIMDDDELIRELLCKMLKRLGYSPESVCNGNEAIDTYHSAIDSGKNFDIVILDLTIPGGMGGKETLTELLKIDPDVKAIMSSGYAGSSILSEYEEYGFKGLAEKPYTMAKLSQVVYNVLNSK